MAHSMVCFSPMELRNQFHHTWAHIRKNGKLELQHSNHIESIDASKFKYIQWNKCLARVSLGMNSAINNLSSPSQQYPIKFASLRCLNFPTPHASSYKHKKIHNLIKYFNIYIPSKKYRNTYMCIHTANCLGSGQDNLGNFLTAIHRRFCRRPL